MKASDYITEFLVSKNITHVFGYIGGMVTHLIDSIYQNDQIEFVNTIHEQGAGFAAEGYARTTGKLAVAIATSGPGATNLLTPLASCFFDSTPALFITGQVNTFEYRKYPEIRQCGFQETNIADMAKPVAKYVVRIEHIEDLRYELEKSYYIAQSGRKGPVLIDLPMNIQRLDYDFSNAKSFNARTEEEQSDYSLSQIVDAVKRAKRPIVLVGNGVRLSDSVDKLNSFIEETQIPVVQSLMGRDVVPFSYDYNLGLIGTYGNRAANIALSLSDVILVFGSRLDIRQIGVKTDIFDGKVIIQVDVDKNELLCGNLHKICIHKDVSTVLRDLLDAHIKINIAAWSNKVSELKARFVSESEIDGSVLIPNMVVSRISDSLTETDVICADVGQHQIWVGQSVKVKGAMRILFSGGLGAMGFALPAAIGATMSGRRAIVIAGDGGLQMNIQELEIVRRRNLPIKIIVMNNKSLSMVRQFQDTYFDGRNPSTVIDYSAPDFENVAAAYGINGTMIAPDDITDEFLHTFFSSNEPALLNIVFDSKTNVSPKVLFGNSIDKMHPLLEESVFAELKSLDEE